MLFTVDPMLLHLGFLRVIHGKFYWTLHPYPLRRMCVLYFNLLMWWITMVGSCSPFFLHSFLPAVCSLPPSPCLGYSESSYSETCNTQRLGLSRPSFYYCYYCYIPFNSPFYFLFLYYVHSLKYPLAYREGGCVICIKGIMLYHGFFLFHSILWCLALYLCLSL